MQEVPLSQGTIRYLDVGSGPPVVFVHGFLVNHELWLPVIDLLSESHRCIAPDWPLGAHSSPMHADADLSPPGIAQLIAEFVRALDLDDVTIVGNDSGGAVCQLVAADHCDSIARLVLTNCDALEVFPPAGFGYLKWLVRTPGAMYALAQAMYRIPMLRRAKTAFGALTKQPLSDAQLERWTKPIATLRGVRRDATKFGLGVDNKLTLAVAERLQQFQGSTLLLWGEDDPFFTLDLATRLQTRFADARLQPIANATVFSPLDQPQQVAAGIARFIADGSDVQAARAAG